MQRQKKNNKPLAAVALVMAIILIIGGTYAWTDYSQHKSNEFSTGEKYLYDVTLIDDFVEVKDWQVGQTVPSNIRVKNMETATGDAYVRLVLKEYLEFGDLEEQFSDIRYMIDTSGDFLKSGESAKSDALDDIKSNWSESRYQVITEDDLFQDSGYVDNGVNHWYVKTKGGDPNGQYGKFLLRTSEYAVTSLVQEAERSNDAYDGNWHQRYPNGECNYTTRTWPADIADLNVSDAHGFTDYISWDLGNDVEVISEWDDYENKNAKWYLDASTGYVYWGKALKPGDVTSDLLENVTLTDRPNTDYFYYNVHADMTAVSDPDDLSVLRSDPPVLYRPSRNDNYIFGTGVPGATIYLTYKQDIKDSEGKYNKTYDNIIQGNLSVTVQDNGMFMAIFDQPFAATTQNSDMVEAYQVEPGKSPSKAVHVFVILPN